MENENKNLAEGGKEASSEKKLNLPLIIGAAVGAVVIIVGIILAVVLLGGGGEECRHVDADDNGKCDKCDVEYEDGDEAVIPTKRAVKIVVSDDSGNTLSGFTFHLKGAGETITFTTDANGSSTEQLYDDIEYTVEIQRPEDGDDTADVAYGFILSTFSIKVKTGEDSVTISLQDNRPNGSLEKPFFISENTEFTLAPGAEVYYSCRNDADSWLEIDGNDFVVIYNDKTLAPEDGTLKLVFDPNESSTSDVKSEVFCIKNNAQAELSSEIEFMVRPGSYNNPYPVESDSFTVSVTSTVYYQYTATADGTLVVKSDNNKNNIKLTNENIVSAYTTGEKAAYIAVSAGDTVKIEIFTIDGEPADIDLAISCHTGTESDPIPLLTSSIEFKLGAQNSLSFSVESGKKIKISNANVTVTTGGDTKEPNSLGMVIVTIGDDGVFTITNTSSERNDVTVEIE